MSRIDRALNLWEGATSVAERPSAPTAAGGDGFALDAYPQEQIPAVAPAPAPVARPVAPVPGERGESRRVATQAGEPDLRARLVTGDMDAVTLEQDRRLAAVLHDAHAERGLKTVMITSTLPGEGKTLTITNLALTLSEGYGRRVLLIDADLRRPALHRMFGVENVHGLSEALLLGDVTTTVSEVSSRLSLMTAGKSGPSPLAALTSDRMGTLLKECAARFDWVLVDTSPAGLLPDGQVLARLIGAVILVINAGSTPAEAVERVVADLQPEYILGTVLNRVEPRRIPESGYYAGYGIVRGDR